MNTFDKVILLVQGRSGCSHRCLGHRLAAQVALDHGDRAERCLPRAHRAQHTDHRVDGQGAPSRESSRFDTERVSPMCYATI